MNTKVRVVSNLWLGSNGIQAAVPVEGELTEDALSRRAKVLALPEPRRLLGCVFLLDDGEEVVVNAPMLPALLPDRSGVLGVFPPGWYVSNTAEDVFKRPNNAAVFNSDGTLRFQIKVGSESIHHIALVYGMLDGKFSGMLGLHAASAEHRPPEQIYALNPEDPQLISTLRTVRF